VAMFLACNEADFDAVAQSCAAPFYTYLPGVFTGWTSADWQAFLSSFLTLVAIALCFRFVIKWVDDL
jgi:hypothetical protein